MQNHSIPNNPKPLAIISGASSGIGLVITQTLLDAGYAVVGMARDFSRSGLGHPDFRAIEIDLADLDALPAALVKIAGELAAPVNVLINNAGIGKMGFLEQLSVPDMRRVMDLNFMSHAIVTKAFLPAMKQRQQGDIIFIGSEAALQGARQGSIYCASKFALRGFAQSLREECGRSHVRITLINPGAVRTPFFQDLSFEPGAEADNAIDPRDVAAAVVTVLQARPGTVIDEINLTPLNHVWKKKD